MDLNTAGSLERIAPGSIQVEWGVPCCFQMLFCHPTNSALSEDYRASQPSSGKGQILGVHNIALKDWLVSKVHYQPNLAYVCGEDNGQIEDALLGTLGSLFTLAYPPKKTAPK